MKFLLEGNKPTADHDIDSYSQDVMSKHVLAQKVQANVILRKKEYNYLGVTRDFKAPGLPPRSTRASDKLLRAAPALG